MLVYNLPPGNSQNKLGQKWIKLQVMCLDMQALIEFGALSVLGNDTHH